MECVPIKAYSDVLIYVFKNAFIKIDDVISIYVRVF